MHSKSSESTYATKTIIHLMAIRMSQYFLFGFSNWSVPDQTWTWLYFYISINSSLIYLFYFLYLFYLSM